MLHVTPPLKGRMQIPPAGKDNNTGELQQQQADHAQQADAAQKVCTEEDVPPQQKPTAAADAQQTAEGVWQVLLQAAVAHEEELCQELIEQCKEEEMDVAPGLKLASRDQFEELALMADFSLSNLPLAGDCEAPDALDMAAGC